MIWGNVVGLSRTRTIRCVIFEKALCERVRECE
jgi:hypothetical protein